MSDERLPRLVVALRKQTDLGKVTWAKTASDGVYQASFPKQSIQIHVRPSAVLGSMSDDVVLTIRDDNGNVVESFADTDLSPNMHDALDVMMNLYEKARRQALGADKAIDDLLEELDDDIPF